MWSVTQYGTKQRIISFLKHAFDMFYNERRAFRVDTARSTFFASHGVLHSLLLQTQLQVWIAVRMGKGWGGGLKSTLRKRSLFKPSWSTVKLAEASKLQSLYLFSRKSDTLGQAQKNLLVLSAIRNCVVYTYFRTLPPNLATASVR